MPLFIIVNSNIGCFQEILSVIFNLIYILQTDSQYKNGGKGEQCGNEIMWEKLILIPRGNK